MANLVTTRTNITETYNTALGRFIQYYSHLIVSALLVIAACFFAPVIQGYWIGDDFYWVHDYLHYAWRDSGKLFLGDWARTSANEYRPLWVLSFMLDLHLWGPNERALHATNILFHLTACTLVWYLAARTPAATVISGILSLAFFILTPLHDEPVAWVAARGHILAPLFMLSTLILLRRYDTRGGIGTYLASIATAIAAFATQEVAVALPALLLLRAMVDTLQLSKRWLWRTSLVHAPFWALLGLYLGFRLFLFGRLGRDAMPSSIGEILGAEYAALRTLWLSPATLPETPAVLHSGVALALLLLATSALLIAPSLFLRGKQLRAYARSVFYYAIGWPLITTLVLMGSASPRHFYLASVGPAVALGMAGAAMLTARRRYVIAGSAALAILLSTYAIGLAAGVAGYARNGERSHQLRREIDTAMQRAASVQNATLVIIPELPDSRLLFWDYFYPVALAPPFAERPTSLAIIPSFASCHCQAEEWTADYGTSITRISTGRSGPTFVVEWSLERGAFVTNVLDRDGFRNGGYISPGGSLVRSGQPQRASVILR